MADEKNVRMEITDEYLEDVIGGARHKGSCPKGGDHEFEKTGVKVLKKDVLKCKKCGKRIAAK
ncbi:hypothetical protein SAMN04487928_12837 [Butyrivibrio proteoclasticus]|uniref:Uncharacterized protein n=2 Tax=Butyrivibrio proteoclasticus TaxID=43305 RepID=A0A1I5X6R7_9FIRM|nr:hypothetical protein SAMN04487928_12837 [Butyrivibrio proteoclasticus]